MCTTNFDDGKLWYLLVSLTLHIICLITSIWDNGGSLFTSRLNRTKVDFTGSFRVFFIIIVLCNITMLSIGIPVFVEETSCPNVLRIFYLFDMMLFTGKVINIMLESYQSRTQLGQIMTHAAS